VLVISFTSIHVLGVVVLTTLYLKSYLTDASVVEDADQFNVAFSWVKPVTCKLAGALHVHCGSGSVHTVSGHASVAVILILCCAQLPDVLKHSHNWAVWSLLAEAFGITCVYLPNSFVLPTSLPSKYISKSFIALPSWLTTSNTKHSLSSHW